jgi:hypothetical protein
MTDLNIEQEPVIRMDHSHAGRVNQSLLLLPSCSSS